MVWVAYAHCKLFIDYDDCGDTGLCWVGGYSTEERALHACKGFKWSKGRRYKMRTLRTQLDTDLWTRDPLKERRRPPQPDMVWLAYGYHVHYNESEFEILGVYSTEEKARDACDRFFYTTRCVYIQDELDVIEVDLDDDHWIREADRQALLERKIKEDMEREEAERKAREAAEAEARRVAEEAAIAAAKERLAAAAKMLSGAGTDVELPSINANPSCSSAEIELAASLVEDMKLIKKRDEDPFWYAKKAAVSRRVKWAAKRLEGKITGLDAIMAIHKKAFPSESQYV